MPQCPQYILEIGPNLLQLGLGVVAAAASIYSAYRVIVNAATLARVESTQVSHVNGGNSAH